MEELEELEELEEQLQHNKSMVGPGMEMRLGTRDVARDRVTSALGHSWGSDPLDS